MVLDKMWKSFAKVNVFLKVVGIRDNYHELSSGFVRVDSLFDEIKFVNKLDKDQISGAMKKIYLEWNFDCGTEDNTIYKAYLYLLEFLAEHAMFAQRQKVIEFLYDYKVVVKKNIPIGSGLGWGSSNAATFLKIMNEELDLKLSLRELQMIGVKIGSDVNFFLADTYSANVRGIWERIEIFEEDSVNLEIFTPEIHCSTQKVFTKFREKFLDETNIDVDFVRTLEGMLTKDILIQYEIDQLNDLLPAVLDVYPEMENYIREWWFLSGSGSSFFRVKN